MLNCTTTCSIFIIDKKSMSAIKYNYFLTHSYQSLSARSLKRRNMKKPTISLEIKSFSNDSSIYGLRYLANSQRPWERTFWVSFCVLSVALSSLVVYRSLTDWKVTCFVSLSYCNTLRIIAIM